MRLILVRHGETEENASDIVQGQIPGNLSRLGREQATAVGSYLAAESLDAVYASDLERARLSAQLALGEGSDSIVTDTRLREQSFGVLEGAPVQRLLKEMRRQKTDWIAFAPAGGEDRAALRLRAQAFLDETVARHGSQTVVVFTHYGIVNALIQILIDGDSKDYDVANGSVTVFEMDGPIVTAEVVNGTAHLPVEAASPTRLPSP